MDFTKLEILEERIMALLNKTTELTQQNGKLELSLSETLATLADSERRLRDADIMVELLQAEKESIVGKIDSLLGRLETV